MKDQITRESVVKASGEQLASFVGREAVLLNLSDSRYYGLDEVGARIWAIIQQPVRVADVRDAIAAEYEVDLRTCEQDVVELLEQLAEHNMIEVAPEPAA